MRTARIVVTILAIAASGQALAQSSILSGRLRESLSQEVQISARLVQGLVIGSGQAPASVGAIKVPLAFRDRSQTYCISMTTRDGNYSAQGEFTAAPGPAVVTPLGQSSAYQRQLQTAYTRSDLGVVVRHERTCNSEPSPTLGAVQYDDSQTLNLMLQARAITLAATLTTAQGETRQGDCRTYESGRSTVISHLCTFALAGVTRAGVSRLTIRRRERGGGWVEAEVPVRLAG